MQVPFKGVEPVGRETQADGGCVGSLGMGADELAVGAIPCEFTISSGGIRLVPSPSTPFPSHRSPFSWIPCDGGATNYDGWGLDGHGSKLQVGRYQLGLILVARIPWSGWVLGTLGTPK